MDTDQWSSPCAFTRGRRVTRQFWTSEHKLVQRRVIPTEPVGNAIYPHQSINLP